MPKPATPVEVQINLALQRALEQIDFNEYVPTKVRIVCSRTRQFGWTARATIVRTVETIGEAHEMDNDEQRW